MVKNPFFSIRKKVYNFNNKTKTPDFSFLENEELKRIILHYPQIDFPRNEVENLALKLNKLGYYPEFIKIREVDFKPVVFLVLNNIISIEFMKSFSENMAKAGKKERIEMFLKKAEEQRLIAISELENRISVHKEILENYNQNK